MRAIKAALQPYADVTVGQLQTYELLPRLDTAARIAAMPDDKAANNILHDMETIFWYVARRAKVETVDPQEEATYDYRTPLTTGPGILIQGAKAGISIDGNCPCVFIYWRPSMERGACRTSDTCSNTRQDVWSFGGGKTDDGCIRIDNEDDYKDKDAPGLKHRAEMQAWFADGKFTDIVEMRVLYRAIGRLLFDADKAQRDDIEAHGNNEYYKRYIPTCCFGKWMVWEYD